MLAMGMLQVDIARALNLSPRRIRQICTEVNEEGDTVRVDRGQVAVKDLPPEFAAMLEFTADAFEEFFNYFSPHKLSPLHKRWVQNFIEHRNLLINVPPRHAKSVIFSVWIPIWLLVRNRNEQIILVSKTNSLAQGFCQNIADQLELTEIPKVFGRFRPEQVGDTTWRPSSGKFLVVGASRREKGVQLSVQARGSMQQILGMEASVIIVDDPTDATVARSETQRENELSWMREQVLTRLMPPVEGSASGRAVVVGQRVHFRDLYGEMAAQRHVRGEKRGESLWTVIKYPAVLDWDTQEVLWPEVWPFEELMVTYERIGGHYPFETVYQQNPIAEGQLIFSPDWWEGCKDFGRPAYEGVRQDKMEENYLPVSRVLSIDPSPEMFSGLVVADVFFKDDAFICMVLECKHWKGGLNEIKYEMGRALSFYKPDYMIFEHSGFSSWLKDDPFYADIKNSSTVKLIEHHTGNNKWNEEFGVQSLAGDIEMGHLRLPYGDQEGRDMTHLLQQEAEDWPFGRTNDIVMALWFIKWNRKHLRPWRALPSHFTGKPGGKSWSWIKPQDKRGLRG